MRAFRSLLRNALFRGVELAALDADSGWAAAAWADVPEPYVAEHGEIDTGPDAHGPMLLLIEQVADR